jgi:hypothetical protein
MRIKHCFAITGTQEEDRSLVFSRRQTEHLCSCKRRLHQADAFQDLPQIGSEPQLVGAFGQHVQLLSSQLRRKTQEVGPRWHLAWLVGCYRRVGVSPYSSSTAYATPTIDLLQQVPIEQKDRRRQSLKTRPNHPLDSTKRQQKYAPSLSCVQQVVKEEEDFAGLDVDFYADGLVIKSRSGLVAFQSRWR